MSGKMISDRSTNPKGERTPKHLKFNNSVGIAHRRHRTLKVTNL
ncbi:hypothetical protein [uncultured Nostoc sp.]